MVSCPNVRTRAREHSPSFFAYNHTCVHTHTHTHTNTNKQTHAHTHKHKHKQTHIYKHTHAHTHTQTHTHTHTLIHTTGTCYYNGQGVEIDFHKAFASYLQAATRVSPFFHVHTHTYVCVCACVCMRVSGILSVGVASYL